MERDKLTEEAAHKRMEAQMTNAEYVRPQGPLGGVSDRRREG